MDGQQAMRAINRAWDESITPMLVDDRSPQGHPSAPHPDPQNALSRVRRWARENAPPNAIIELADRPQSAPALIVEIPGQAAGNVLLYGHLARSSGRMSTLIKDQRLYGRAATEVGFSVLATLTAVSALREQGIPHPRCLLMIDCGTQSTRPETAIDVEEFADRIGTPDAVLCLDSSAGDYERLWLTTSLRGIVAGTLKVDVLEEAVSGADAGGVIPSGFRILRHLLDRVEESSTGQLKLPELNVDIPRRRVAQARAAAAVLGDVVSDRFPWVDGAEPVHPDRTELILNGTWRPSLLVTGVEGFPATTPAEHVVRRGGTLQFTASIPPTVRVEDAVHLIKTSLEADPPYGARVSCKGYGVSGWHASMQRPWLHAALDAASSEWFGEPAMYVGSGDSVSNMRRLSEKFPRAQFIVTGVCGPGARNHAPSKFLHLPTAKKVTGCVASILGALGERG